MPKEQSVRLSTWPISVDLWGDVQRILRHVELDIKQRPEDFHPSLSEACERVRDALTAAPDGQGPSEPRRGE